MAKPIWAGQGAAAEVEGQGRGGARESADPGGQSVVECQQPAASSLVQCTAAPYLNRYMMVGYGNCMGGHECAECQQPAASSLVQCMGAPCGGNLGVWMGVVIDCDWVGLAMSVCGWM